MTSSGYSRTPKLLKGAIIQFSAPLLIPIPNIVVFQYNPESLARTLAPWAPPPDKEAPDPPEKEQEKRAQPVDPEETFNVVLELDATDALEFPDTHPVAVLSGVADRVAALEMLCYPTGESILGGLLGSLSASIDIGGFSASIGGGAKAEVVQPKKVPVVLFFWGPGRIVPVRITSFSVEEQAFSPLLYPLRAKVNIGMKVLTPESFTEDEKKDPIVKLASGCYTFTRAQKELLATANLANSVESIVSMLPL
jgi:hypothetical protein